MVHVKEPLQRYSSNHGLTASWPRLVPFWWNEKNFHRLRMGDLLTLCAFKVNRSLSMLRTSLSAQPRVDRLWSDGSLLVLELGVEELVGGGLPIETVQLLVVPWQQT